MNKCPECGKELPKESRFCPYCIYKFEQEENNSYAETCGCSHIYTNVTCTKPSICELCGMVALEALGH